MADGDGIARRPLIGGGCDARASDALPGADGVIGLADGSAGRIAPACFARHPIQIGAATEHVLDRAGGADLVQGLVPHVRDRDLLGVGCGIGGDAVAGKGEVAGGEDRGLGVAVTANVKPTSQTPESFCPLGRNWWLLSRRDVEPGQSVRISVLAPQGSHQGDSARTGRVAKHGAQVSSRRRDRDGFRRRYCIARSRRRNTRAASVNPKAIWRRTSTGPRHRGSVSRRRPVSRCRWTSPPSPQSFTAQGLRGHPELIAGQNSCALARARTVRRG